MQPRPAENRSLSRRASSESASRSRPVRGRLSGWVAALTVLVVGASFLTASPASAITWQPGFNQVRVANDVGPVVAMAFAPDGRLFVAAQDGTVRIIKDGKLLPTPFLKLAVDKQGERGLTGIAIDPDFTQTPYVYLYYAVPTSPAHNRVSRFTANGDVAATSGGKPVEKVLLDLDNLTATNIHNGGAMHFDSHEKLFVSVGDNVQGRAAQRTDNLLGKVLRIDPKAAAGGDDSKLFPADNPYYASATGRNRAIWATGLRNPFTFDIQPGTDRLLANDVGASAWEEINDIVKGGNYGWPDTEGPTTNPAFKSPVYAYAHGDTDSKGCAVTGGAFYNPKTVAYPSSYVGKYFFTDMCNGWIKVFDPVTQKVEPLASQSTAGQASTGIPVPVGMTVGPDGYLYYLSRTEPSSVYRVGFSGSLAPVIAAQPEPQTVTLGDKATFSVQASGATPLTYQWRRDGVAIAGATGSSYTTPSTTTSDDGAKFSVVVTNASGSTTSADAALMLSSNRAPLAAIVSPKSGTLYSGGDVLHLKGSGTDPEEGDLPASRLSWRIDLHHDEHVHPGQSIEGTKETDFTVPPEGHTESTVFYRVNLTVADKQGRTGTTYVDVRPRKIKLTLATQPAGLQVLLDDQPKVAPYTEDSVVGVKRPIGVPTTQTHDGHTYEFVSWSDGGAAQHTVSTPTVSTTYTAVFKEVGGSGAPSTLTLKPTADAYAAGGAPTTNLGADASLATRSGSDGAISYLRFALPDAPTGKKLTGATLVLRTTTLSTAGSDGSSGISIAADDWSESGLTWKNRPAITGPGLARTPEDMKADSVYRMPLKSSVLADRLGSSISVGLSGRTDNTLWFWSREQPAEGYQPQLVLTFG